MIDRSKASTPLYLAGRYVDCPEMEKKRKAVLLTELNQVGMHEILVHGLLFLVCVSLTKDDDNVFHGFPTKQSVMEDVLMLFLEFYRTGMKKDHGRQLFCFNVVGMKKDVRWKRKHVDPLVAVDIHEAVDGFGKGKCFFLEYVLLTLHCFPYAELDSRLENVYSQQGASFHYEHGFFGDLGNGVLAGCLNRSYGGFFLQRPLVSYTAVIIHVAVSKASKSMSDYQGLRVTSQSHGLSPNKTRGSDFSKKRIFCLFPGINQCKGYPPNNNAKLFHWHEKVVFLVSFPADFKEKRILSLLDERSLDGPRVHVLILKAFHFFCNTPRWSDVTVLVLNFLNRLEATDGFYTPKSFTWDLGKCFIEMHPILFTSTGPFGPLIKVLQPLDSPQGLLVHGMHFADQICFPKGNGLSMACTTQFHVHYGFGGLPPNFFEIAFNSSTCLPRHGKGASLCRKRYNTSEEFKEKWALHVSLVCRNGPLLDMDMNDRGPCADKGNLVLFSSWSFYGQENAKDFVSTSRLHTCMKFMMKKYVVCNFMLTIP